MRQTLFVHARLDKVEDAMESITIFIEVISNGILIVYLVIKYKLNLKLYSS